MHRFLRVTLNDSEFFPSISPPVKDQMCKARRGLWSEGGAQADDQREFACYMFSRAPASRSYGAMGVSADRRKLAVWVKTLDQMEGPIDLDAYTPLLRCCKALSHGKRLHLYMALNGYDQILYIQNTLLDMYGKCGSLDDTCALFAKMHTRDVFSWNVTISAHARGGHINVAFQLFQRMWWYDVQPNQFTLVSILSVCTNQSVRVVGEHMHACIVMGGCEDDVVVDTAIVNMYSKCGDLKAARVMFEKMVTRNVYSWSAMIAAYAQHGQGEDALQLFDLMQHQGELPNKVTFISVLDACASLGALVIGTRARARVMGTEIECDAVVATAFVNMYAKCNHVQEARKVFDTMPDPNVISWNAMISAYAQHGEGMAAFKLFNQMQEKQVEPNKATFVSALDACAGIMALKEGESLHVQITTHCFEPDVVISTALVNMYGKCGCLGKAHEVFEKMPYRNIVSWNAVIAVHAQHGHCKEAFELFYQMQWEGIVPDKVTFVSMFDACARLPALADGKRMHAQIVVKGFELDVTVGTAIINMYGKCGITEEARRLFDLLPERNTITWSSMIGAYVQHEQGNDAFRLYARMHQECIKPDRITYISILDVCASMAALAEGEQVHVEVVMEAYESDDVVGTALISLYGKCGSLEAAWAVFNKMSVQGVVTWNALIAGYAQHGHGKVTLELFYQMQDAGVRPTEVTFISVLNACSHAGLVKEGRHCFYTMSQKYGITASTDHYGCMVDLLGRAGLLDEAEGLINSMLDQPTAVTWMSLLGACRYQTDIKRGERAASNLFRLDPENAAPCVMLSNLYAAAGMVDAAALLMSEEVSQKHVSSMFLCT